MDTVCQEGYRLSKYRYITLEECQCEELFKLEVYIIFMALQQYILTYDTRVTVMPYNGQFLENCILC
ncbi:MAG: hypothetical protein US50_C0066G0002 [Candidatus Nomurabacteria bacterium GW2011_GWB1_37_5]|uniref:Uncharacterized protein n=1 Tax=Candidatus Nomurabacteria bacterium GW2011_GWB1_37_5 TaxID=1618742 RepID=A0A0G0GV79_9BACT|nr:MAG: hypothetical protein US50_C0066G0002 [Candidatus Nomurabacteria bacterium GW2011_GWB1_37_5]